MPKYVDIRGSLKTGDVILFNGNSRVSKVIKHFSRSEFSHVGVVWRVPEWDLNMLWESTSIGKLPDMLDGTMKRGVQTVALSQKINQYDGQITIRQLNNPITDVMRDEMIALRAELKNRPYEENMIDLATAVFDNFRDNDEDLSSLFCSELVAELYQRMSLLPHSKSSSEYVPADFGSRFMGNIGNGYSLGGEIKITG